MKPGAIDWRRHRALAGASRVRLLEHPRAGGAEVTAGEIAAEAGLHPNTVRLGVLFAAVVPGPHARPADGGPDDGHGGLAGALAAQTDSGSPHAADDAARDLRPDGPPPTAHPEGLPS